MEAARAKRIIVLVATPDDAGRVVADLRSHGHQLRVAPDIQVACKLSATGKADLFLCDASTILKLAPNQGEEAGHLRAAVAGAIHDLRNLLDALADSVDELSRLASVARRADRAETLARARQRIRMIRPFLADLLAEIWNGLPQELRAADANLEDLVEGAAIIVYSEAWRKDQRLVINIDDEAAHVWADPAKLKRVLTNLLGNAVRQTPVAGTVTVEARREGSDCLIAISDSGKGIPRDEIPRLFPPLESADVPRPSPAGAGLSIVRSLVEQHGGRVWAESRPGQGTVIFVSLPQPAPAAESATGRGTSPRDGQGARE